MIYFYQPAIPEARRSDEEGHEMAVWLHTAEGKTRKYKTTYEIDGGLDDPKKYAIRCKGD